jgi:hypothetical protein
LFELLFDGDVLDSGWLNSAVLGWGLMRIRFFGAGRQEIQKFSEGILRTISTVAHADFFRMLAK